MKPRSHISVALASLMALMTALSLLAACGSSAAPAGDEPTLPGRTDSGRGTTSLTPSPTSAPAGFTLACTLTTDQLPELSGLTSSILHPGILWAHNDSGDVARVFAIDSETCGIRAVVRLAGVTARDVEAIATGRSGDGTAVIWLADIGDNSGSHSSVRLYRFAEPTVLEDQSVTTRSFKVTYADGPRNAEGLLVAPTPDGPMWIVSKQLRTRPGLYALPEDFLSAGEGVAHRVGSVDVASTDASYAPDGSRYLIRTYLGATLFDAPPPGSAIAQVALPLFAQGQIQGEAIAFSQDSQSAFVASEGSKDIYRVPLP